MKKFAIVVGMILLLLLALRYFIVYEYFYIDFRPNADIKAHFTVNQSKIYDNTSEESVEILIKGVTLDSVLPGYYSTDYAPSLEIYQNWLRQISEMGANTVTVNSIMDSEFYEAIKAHNEADNDLLYLIQGISFNEYDTNNAEDYYSAYQELINDSYRAVDVIHGADFFAIGRMESGGIYNHDVSNWTIGYIIGNTWVPTTVAYTDNNIDLPTSYEGTYFSTSEEATRTEVLIADILDKVLAYETNKYKTQRLMTFNNSYTTDPIEYSDTAQYQLDKFVQMNIDHIVASDKVESGLFAGYAMKTGMDDFVNTLSEADASEYADLLTQVNTASIYGGYVHFLNLLHDLPVVITNHTESTARGVDTTYIDDDRLTEKEQGDILVDSYNSFMNDGCQGVVLTDWQDNWSRSTWNTSYAVNSTREQFWYNAQSKSQSNGVLGFSTNDGDVCYVDGEISEWTSKDIILNTDDYNLSVRYDEGYMYFMVSGEKVDEYPLTIPIDVTPKPVVIPLMAKHRSKPHIKVIL